MILLDTNLLGRMTDSNDPQCAEARRAVHKLLVNGESLILVPQNLYEFWSIATRKRGVKPTGENGLGLTCNQTAQWIAFFRRRFTLLADRDDLVDVWLSIVKSFAVPGRRSHDARLVAAMQTHTIDRLLTYNAVDFKQFPITILDPASI